MKLPLFSIMTALTLFIAGPVHASPPPGVAPPKITVLKSGGRNLANGLIFIGPKAAGLGIGAPPGPIGPEIVDNQGRPIWFNPITNGQSATDFRVQQYRGQPVLTWSQSAGIGGQAVGQTVDYILDTQYQVIATVLAGNGYDADSHEFRITPQNTALITIYNAVPYDLSSVGGPTAGYVVEGVVQEIDIESGKVLFEWHSLDHVGLDESYNPLPASPTTAGKAWDYFHLNAVSLDVDGNLLISARHTWTVYKLDRQTGAVIWRLGGKKSDFTLGPGVRFAWQHNPIAVNGNTIRIFDNESNGTPVLPYSRVIWVNHNDSTKTATLARWFKHPDALSAPSQGDSQGLNNSDTFVGWGALGRFSEFDSRGNLLFDANVPAGYDTYRAYRFAWQGNPNDEPTATAQLQGNGSAIVHAIWNGATQVASWEVLNGSSGQGPRSPLGFPGGQKQVAATPWNALGTTITVPNAPASIVVVAKDALGLELGRSPVTPVAP
jgi:Arylsulfotransferase (ASST)